MRVKQNFHRILNAMEKPLVKRGPEQVANFEEMDSFEEIHRKRILLLPSGALNKLSFN